MERQLELEAARGRALVEESREPVVVLDGSGRVLASSRRARLAFEGLREGEPLPDGARAAAEGDGAASVALGAGERLVYLAAEGGAGAYEELRSGFTAAVSHELRTPLARLLALLETAQLPGEDAPALVERAREEVEQIRELIDEVLFLSELETGRAPVALGRTAVRPVLDEVVAELGEAAARAAVTVRAEGGAEAAVALRPRMLRVVASNLAANAIRYAGAGATCTLAVERDRDRVVLRASDDGIGVLERDLPRLFERFYRADRVRSSRGTGLGLAIVKHVVAAAGGEVEARGARGRGLEIRCSFPAA